MDSVFDIQIFADSVPKSSDDTVSLLNKVLNQLGLKNYTKLKFDNKNDVNMHPLLNFVGKFLYKEAKDLDDDAKKRQTYVSSFATLITKSISIVDDAATIILKFKNAGSEKPKVGSYSSNIASIVNNIGLMGEAISKINEMKGNKNKGNSWLLPILTSSVALVFNGLTAIDGLSEEEYSKIQKSYLKFLQTAGTALVKNILSGDLVKDAAAGSAELFKNKAFSQTVTKTIGIFFTLANSAVTGIDKYKSTFKTYTDDGIPEDMAKHDAVVNAIATVLHDLATYYTKGIDDLIFAGTKNLVSWIIGKESKAFKGKNYVEVMAEMFKNFNFNNTGTSNGDYIISYEDSGKVYGEGGGDEIRNFASHVTIWAGTGNDTVFSHREWKNTKNTKENENEKFHSNSILSGKGDDVVVSYAVGDTIYGDEGKDKLTIYGTGTSCRAYGGAGDDYVAVFGAKKNWVNGGLGNDIIILDGVKNATVEYGAGDGNDIIYGYNESDRLQVKGKYQMSTVESSIVLTFSKGAITLDGAYGKTVNINGKKIKTVEDKTKLIDFIATIPSVWDNDVKIIRGTSKGDNIRNITDDVIIEALSGNDTIKNGGYWSYEWHNGGTNTTIFGGAGNDNIENYHGDNVTIDAGVGNDFIQNHGDSKNVTISGDSGNDSIGNYDSKNVTIIGGSGNDSIHNISSSKMKIFGGTGNDSIYSGNYDKSIDYDDGTNITVSGDAGNDYIYNDEDYSLILGDKGNDSIENHNNDNSTISGGAGSDYIYNNWARYATIFGGTGNDSIYNNCGYHVKISGGSGNDYISLSGLSNYNVIQYASGDGNDTISLFDSNDTLHITKGNYKTKVLGNNVIVTVGKGSITLKDAVGKQISIKNSKGKVTTKTYGSSTSALFAENNFVTSDNLSEIMKNNLTPTALEKMETNNFENLTQENNLITYSEK